jgi:hypothetical protein
MKRIVFTALLYGCISSAGVAAEIRVLSGGAIEPGLNVAAK